MAMNVVTSRVRNLRDLLEAMKRSEYFDAAWYRRQSLGARMSPSATLHYLLWGWRQGLNPSPRFDTKFYVARYRDVAESKANPLKHFLIHGHAEGRLATRSGRIFREHLSPEFSPLPLFGAPAGAIGRLSLVIDDHTPRLLGVGFAPLLGLATHSAAGAGISLRIIIRSRSVTTQEISEAIALSAGVTRPTIDITRREPGPTDDVETVPDDRWWASSASSYESLRSLVPAKRLWWVMAANEVARSASGDYRECAAALLASPDTQVIAVGKSVAQSVPSGLPLLSVSRIPLSPSRSKSTAPTKAKRAKVLGVVIAPSHPESLPTASVSFVEHALTHQLIDPTSWTIRLLGVDWEPLTLSGSIVVEQSAPASPAAWLGSLESLDALIALGSQTEHPWLAECAALLGIPVVTQASADALSVLVSTPPSPRTTPDSWESVVKPIVAALERAGG